MPLLAMLAFPFMALWGLLMALDHRLRGWDGWAFLVTLLFGAILGVSAVMAYLYLLVGDWETASIFLVTALLALFGVYAHFADPIWEENHSAEQMARDRSKLRFPEGR